MGQPRDEEEGGDQAGFLCGARYPPRPAVPRKGPHLSSCPPLTSRPGPGPRGSPCPPGPTGSPSVPRRPGKRGAGALGHLREPGATGCGPCEGTCPSLPVQGEEAQRGGPCYTGWQARPALSLHPSHASRNPISPQDLLPFIPGKTGFPQAQLHPAGQIFPDNTHHFLYVLSVSVLTTPCGVALPLPPKLKVTCPGAHVASKGAARHGPWPLASRGAEKSTVIIRP